MRVTSPNFGGDAEGCCLVPALERAVAMPLPSLQPTRLGEAHGAHRRGRIGPRPAGEEIGEPSDEAASSGLGRRGVRVWGSASASASDSARCLPLARALVARHVVLAQRTLDWAFAAHLAVGRRGTHGLILAPARLGAARERLALVVCGAGEPAAVLAHALWHATAGGRRA